MSSLTSHSACQVSAGQPVSLVLRSARLTDRARLAVVREPSGQLRTATWEEQDRLNLIYFPTEGRKHYTPQMFQPEHIKHILGPEKYEYILDR